MLVLKSADSGANAPNYTHWLTGTVKIDEEKENRKKSQWAWQNQKDGNRSARWVCSTM